MTDSGYYQLDPKRTATFHTKLTTPSGQSFDFNRLTGEVAGVTEVTGEIFSEVQKFSIRKAEDFQNLFIKGYTIVGKPGSSIRIVPEFYSASYINKGYQTLKIINIENPSLLLRVSGSTFGQKLPELARAYYEATQCSTPVSVEEISEVAQRIGRKFGRDPRYVIFEGAQGFTKTAFPVGTDGYAHIAENVSEIKGGLLPDNSVVVIDSRIPIGRTVGRHMFRDFLKQTQEMLPGLRIAGVRFLSYAGPLAALFLAGEASAELAFNGFAVTPKSAQLTEESYHFFATLLGGTLATTGAVVIPQMGSAILQKVGALAPATVLRAVGGGSAWFDSCILDCSSRECDRADLS